MQTCWKCGSIRAPDTDAPEWQCPSCGVAYNKAPKTQPRDPTSPRRRQARSVRETWSRARGYAITHPQQMAAITLMMIAIAVLGWWLWFKSPWSTIAAQNAFADKSMALLKQSLIDPESARFRQVRVVTIERDGVQMHSLCGLVNSKNRFGGYTGENRFFVMHLGRIETDNSKISFETDYRDFCEGRCAPSSRCDKILRHLAGEDPLFE